MEIIKTILGYFKQILEILSISDTGYFEHFIVGFIISGLISHLYFEKTYHKFKSIFLGLSTAFFVGLLKEYVDPLIGGDKDKLDLIYTILGSITGAIIFLLITYVQKKKT